MCINPTGDRVWVEVNPDAEPISGVIHRGRAPARPFAGWLELVALLESELGRAMASGTGEDRA